MTKIKNRIEPLVGVTVLALLAVGCFLVLRPFLAAILWALVLTFSTWPAFRWFERAFGGRTTLAAAVMTALLASAMLVPLVVLGFRLADNVYMLADKLRVVMETGPPGPPVWLNGLPILGPYLAEQWSELAADTSKLAQVGRQYLGPVTEWTLAAGAKLGQGILELALSVFAAFFFYRDGTVAARRLHTVIEKVAGHRAERLTNVAEGTMKGVVYGVIGTGLAQATLAAFGFWLAGVPGWLFWGLVTFVVSVFALGAPIVWVPATLWLFSTGETAWGIFLGIWGLLVVSGIDNFLKPYFISRVGALPLLLVFLGILGGVIAFGFLGIFLGPTLLAIAYTLVREWSSTRIAAIEARPVQPKPEPTEPAER